MPSLALRLLKSSHPVSYLVEEFPQHTCQRDYSNYKSLSFQEGRGVALFSLSVFPSLLVSSL